MEYRKMVEINYLQDRNRDTDMENRCMNTEKEEGDRLGELDWHIYTIMCKIDS